MTVFEIILVTDWCITSPISSLKYMSEFLVHVFDGIGIRTFEYYNVGTGDLETECRMKKFITTRREHTPVNRKKNIQVVVKKIHVRKYTCPPR